jgi:hypothetical protein
VYELYEPLPIKRNESFIKNYWESYSPRLQRDVYFLGQLNYEFWLMLEINTEISTYCERPTIIKGVHNKRRFEITPNFWVQYKNGEESFVILEYEKAKKPKFDINLLEEWCYKQNKKLEVIKETYILQNQLIINNSKRLISFLSRKNVIEMDLHRIIKCLTTEKITIKSLVNELKSSLTDQRIIESIYFLIFHNRIASNITEKPINLNTVVWLHCQKDE